MNKTKKLALNLSNAGRMKFDKGRMKYASCRVEFDARSAQIRFLFTVQNRRRALRRDRQDSPWSGQIRSPGLREACVVVSSMRPEDLLVSQLHCTFLSSAACSGRMKYEGEGQCAEEYSCMGRSMVGSNTKIEGRPRIATAHLVGSNTTRYARFKLFLSF